MTNDLHDAVRTARRQDATRNLPPGHEDRQWVANSATLVRGHRDTAPIDTVATIDQNARLVVGSLRGPAKLLKGSRGAAR